MKALCRVREITDKMNAVVHDMNLSRESGLARNSGLSSIFQRHELVMGRIGDRIGRKFSTIPGTHGSMGHLQWQREQPRPSEDWMAEEGEALGNSITSVLRFLDRTHPGLRSAEPTTDETQGEPVDESGE